MGARVWTWVKAGLVLLPVLLLPGLHSLGALCQSEPDTRASHGLVYRLPLRLALDQAPHRRGIRRSSR